MYTVARDLQIHLRADAGDLKMLEDLAAHEERSASDVVRRLIRRAHAETFGEPRTSAEAMALRAARTSSASAMVLSEGLAERRRRTTKKRGKGTRTPAKK